MNAPRIDELARLVADPSRARMLDALMDGRAWTGRELARFAHVTPSTASEHLQRLRNGALIEVLPQGRHRYYRLASPDVARALEALSFLARQDPQRAGSGADAQMRDARTCYDHLAGRLGVAITDSLVAQDAIHFGVDGGELTQAGIALFGRLGIRIAQNGARRPQCKPCLDWSERRYHLAGAAGAALARHALDRQWVRRNSGTRALTISQTGIDAIRTEFGVRW